MSRLLMGMLLAITTLSTNTARANGPEKAHDSAEIQNTVDNVLADPEYRHLLREQSSPAEKEEQSNWLKKILEWLFRADTEPASISEGVFNISGIIFYSVLTLLVVVLIVIMVSLVQRKVALSSEKSFDDPDFEEAINPSRPPGDVPANEYERRAVAAAQSGDHRSALRELVLGSMSWTERSGLIRYRCGLTNRDYIRAVWRQFQRRESLLQIVTAFERVYYGRRTADPRTFEACLLEFRKSFSLETTDANLAS